MGKKVVLSAEVFARSGGAFCPMCDCDVAEEACEHVLHLELDVGGPFFEHPAWDQEEETFDPSLVEDPSSWLLHEEWVPAWATFSDGHAEFSAVFAVPKRLLPKKKADEWWQKQVEAVTPQGDEEE